MGITVACIEVARIIHHLFEVESMEEDLCTLVLAHTCLNCVAMYFGKLVLGTRFICEYQDIVKYIGFKLDDVVDSSCNC